MPRSGPALVKPTLSGNIGLLNERDQLTLMFILNSRGRQCRSPIEIGMLPFIPLEEVFEALRDARASEPIVRSRAIKIESKLGSLRATFTTALRLALDNCRVIKHFGQNPEMGRIINSIEGRPTVALRYIGFITIRLSHWNVFASKQREAVELWLIDHCR